MSLDVLKGTEKMTPEKRARKIGIGLMALLRNDICKTYAKFQQNHVID